MKRCVLHLLSACLPLAIVTASVGLPLVAQAAPNQNSSRSNNAGIVTSESGAETDERLGGIIQDGHTEEAELISKVDAFTIKMKAMQDQLTELQALSQEIDSLRSELASVRKENVDLKTSLSDKIDEATNTFSDQVAPLLDPEVVQKVLSALDAASKDAAKSAQASEGADADLDGLTEIESALDAVTGSVDELQKVVEKATSGLKDTLKTQV